MAKKLGGFALSGQGLGSRSKKGRVAMGGRANADDKKNSPEFMSGRLNRGMSEMNATPRMNQAPAKTKRSKKGVSGTSLKVGKQKGDSLVRHPRLKNSGKGAKSVLPLGMAEQTAPISSRLKNEKRK